MKKLLTSMMLMLASVLMLNARDAKYVQKVFVSEQGLELNYNILYPENFDGSRSYPVIVLLHGSGERGDDNKAQLIHGGELFRTSDELCETIVIIPQCPVYATWTYSQGWEGYPYHTVACPTEVAVKELIDCFISLGFADPKHIYGTGLSMGGIGILDMALRYPGYFAAIQPICGGVNPQRCSEFKGGTAFRFFHGSDDKAVNPNGSRLANKALVEAGFESSMVEYPGVGHGSWNNAFAEPDFLSWFFKH